MDTAWTRVEQIFSDALALPPADRAAFVEAACAGDASTREEVLRLLNAQDRVGDFLESSLLDFRGQQFGAYRATEELGRGGMSVVYLGERTAGGFDKRVAIKVILAQSAAAPETQILASLEHANVARLIDAGTTELGFRYLLMEQVEGGVPVTAFAAGRTEAQKLRLFLQICAGVQAAHQSLIVHRDLKPDNILVTPAGEVKLLDFGIAKMLAPTGTQTVGLRAYTADYASPEQILGHPASTANDIYSLGVILYEMLTGQLPRVLSGLMLEEVVRQAQHDEVPLAPLTGDLAMIAGKALRREPGERYESAGALARDIERYLAGEAIEARPPSWRYRAGRFVSRHRYPVAAAALAASALAGTAVYAFRQAQLAETRFGQVRSLARSVMFELHDAVEPLKGSLPARQMIVDRSLTYLDALARDQGAGNEVLLDVARGYLRLATIQGSDFEKASLGESTAALQRAQQAVAMARRVMAGGRGAQRVAAQTVLVEALDAVASGQARAGKAKEAAATAQEQVKLAEELLAAAPQDSEVQSTAAASRLRLGEMQAELMDWKNALPTLARAEELYRALAQAAPKDLIARNHWARSLNYLATNSIRSGDKTAGTKYAKAAVDASRSLYEAAPKKFRALYGSDLGTLGYLESAAGRYQQAVDLYTEQLRLRREILADNPKDAVTGLRVGATLTRLGLQLRKAGRFAEAIRAGEESLQVTRPLQAADPTNAYARTEVLFGLTDLADTFEAAGLRHKACALQPEVNALLADKLMRGQLDHAALAKRMEKLAAVCAK